MKLKVIAFDADDTLWVNEPYFQEIENKFCALLEDYLPAHTVSQELFNTQMQNIHLYGYGIKSFILSIFKLYIVNKSMIVYPTFLMIIIYLL